MKSGHSVLAQAEDNTAFALKTSGETLRSDKKGDKSTYEDPGLAVGGGPNLTNRTPVVETTFLPFVATHWK